MNLPRSNSSLRTRRNLLGALAGAVPAAALLASPSAAVAAPDALAEPTAEDLFSLARLRSYKSRRSSSWDRTGANADSVRVEPGATATLLDVTGPGVVTHIWFTINSDDPMHLKNLVLRAWWDGESSPSVEVPIGDFYGLGLGEYFNYQSALLTVAPAKALNCYFEMPFATAAKITVTNEGPKRTDNLYFAVDYVTLASLPEGLGRFHAQFRQAAPCHGWTNNWTHNWEDPVGDKKNLDGADNYVFLEATGRGHFVGVTQSVLQNQNDWFGEGDDMFFIDGDKMPTINGTGTEDYYNGAWDFEGQQFAYQHNGAPFITGAERIGSRYSLYRWHLESPIAFEQSIRVTIEHGHANHRSDNFYSTAYWYQTEPHAPFPALPAVADRVPRLFDVGGGAGVAKVPESK
jgi:hypothetical protein